MTQYDSEYDAIQDGRRVVAFDFDGTLATYNKWGNGELGKPIPHVVDILKRDAELGHYVIIFTTRCNSRLWGKAEAAIQKCRILAWLADNRLDGYVRNVVGDKPMADKYYDDRSINPTVNIRDVERFRYDL